MRLQLRGRYIWRHEDETGADGRPVARSYVIARIPDDLTPEEWLRRYDPGATS
jgi:hypothetical protein